MIPAATYFATHPEWWGLDAKTGQRSKDLQMCFSNSELAKQVADKVALAIDLDAAYGPQGLDARSPLPNAVAVVQGDGNGFCECGPCAAIYKEEGAAFASTFVVDVRASRHDELVDSLLCSLVARWPNFWCGGAICERHCKRSRCQPARVCWGAN